MVSFCLDQDRDGSAEEEADSDDQDKRSGSQHIKAQDPGTDAQNNHDGSRERPGVTDDQWTDSKGEDQECPAVVIPVLTQHYAMLQRNLLYTGVTRGKRLVVLVGQEKAVAIAVRNVSGRRRWSKLNEWLGDASGGDVGSRVAFSSSC